MCKVTSSVSYPRRSASSAVLIFFCLVVSPSDFRISNSHLESAVLEIPVIRWGKPYESLEKQEVVHFEPGEVLAKVHQANGGMLKMDKRHSQRARDALRQIPIDTLIEMAA